MPYAAVAPEKGARLTGDGPLKTCFYNNIAHLKYCFAYPSTSYVPQSGFWTATWPTANEGRMLAGAGHSLRWVEDPDLRTIVDTIVHAAAQRQSPNGYCLAYPESSIYPQQAPLSDATDGERPNYDRAMWTRGMVAAILSGSSEAGTVLRKFYNWFNSWNSQSLGTLIRDSLGCQGHVGSTLTYHSTVGLPDDLVTAERYYVQDWWLTQLANAEPLCISNYPLDRPHSYLIIGLEAYVDHYRATGAQKYLDAALGGWTIFHRDFSYNGDGTSITEHGDFPPHTQHLESANNEGCGSVFWIDFNHRLLQLFPDQEKYAAEIERYLYNVCLAQQGSSTPFGVRYHANYEGSKEWPKTISTCDEVTEMGLYGRLPQYLYSIASEGLYVNLYESSEISWQQGTATVTITTGTQFPFAMSVSHMVFTSQQQQVSMKLRIRVPSWGTSAMAIAVNGTTVAYGQPGTYVTLNRTWSNNDVISYSLPAGFTLTKYDGVTQIQGFNRYCVRYGPVLLSLTGTWNGTYIQHGGNYVPRLRVDPANLISSLVPVPGKPLNFTVTGSPGVTYMPYWQVPDPPTQLSTYPIVQA